MFLRGQSVCLLEDPAEMHAKVVMYRLFIKSQELQDELAKFEKEISQEWVAKRGLVV